MIYALEWYDVPKWNINYLVEYHPYLTKGDYERLETLNLEYMFTKSATFVLASIFSGRFL